MPAYSRSNPRYRRLYATKDLRRKGYRKVGEREFVLTDYPQLREKVLIYRRRTWSGGVTLDTFAHVYPDGSIRERHEAQPGIIENRYLTEGR